jgi:hypothetical protein
MKKKVTLCFVILFLTLTTCGPEIKFTEPQPQGISNLKFIPLEYQGRFRNQSDSSLLIIDSNSVVKEWTSTEKIHRDTLEKELKMKISRDTSFKFRDDQLLVKTQDFLFLTIRLSKDSAKVRIKGYELLFTIADTNLVRTYKKFCFLNFKTKDGHWLVKTLRIKGNLLDFSDLIDAKEIEDIKIKTKVTAIKDTSSQKVIEYRLSPSLRDMRRILRDKKLENIYLRN